jgi:hypothetical protein
MTAPQLTVVHASTEDLPNGAPWPPDGNDHWSVVDRADGTTKWRRIALTEITRVVLAASDARPIDGGKTGPQQNDQTPEDY